MLFSCQKSLAPRRNPRRPALRGEHSCSRFEDQYNELMNVIDAPTSNRDAQKDGGADRDRTGDPLLAKQVLSQLSYSPMIYEQRWWAWVESNYRPHPYQGCALTN